MLAFPLQIPENLFLLYQSNTFKESLSNICFRQEPIVSLIHFRNTFLGIFIWLTVQKRNLVQVLPWFVLSHNCLTTKADIYEADKMWYFPYPFKFSSSQLQFSIKLDQLKLIYCHCYPLCLMEGSWSPEFHFILRHVVTIEGPRKN